jgi:hypothetical protein
VPGWCAVANKRTRRFDPRRQGASHSSGMAGAALSLRGVSGLPPEPIAGEPDPGRPGGPVRQSRQQGRPPRGAWSSPLLPLCWRSAGVLLALSAQTGFSRTFVASAAPAPTPESPRAERGRAASTARPPDAPRGAGREHRGHGAALHRIAEAGLRRLAQDVPRELRDHSVADVRIRDPPREGGAGTTSEMATTSTPGGRSGAARRSARGGTDGWRGSASSPAALRPVGRPSDPARANRPGPRSGPSRAPPSCVRAPEDALSHGP